MGAYERVIAAIDPFADGEAVLSRSRQIARSSGAPLVIQSVIEPVRADVDWVVAPSYIDLMEEFEAEALAHANKVLQALCERCQVTPSATYVETGKPVPLIVERAKTLEADLIVIGSHSARGLRRLLGSTCYGVLHHATTDVLVVRINADDPPKA